MHFWFSAAVVTLALACAVSASAAWQPIVGSGASFAIQQSHPGGHAISHLENNIQQSALARSEEDDGLAASYADAEQGFDVDNAHASISGYEYGAKSAPSYFEEPAPVGGFANHGTCEVSKYAFNNEGTVHYRNKLPELDQFSICFWMRFTKHTGDHTILTYSASKAPREIQIWVANANNSSFISMAIHGQSLYRLNYPVRMGRWHHLCTSWNGKTGEWQAWMKAERIGRGFLNRLVNHKIPGRGILFSGGPSVTGPTADGLHFEMTLLQVYNVALTAGKAHRDHKHHHVHHFNHEGRSEATTRAPPSTPQPVQQPNVLLANGQIPNRIRLNLANAQQMGSNGVPSQVLGSIIAAEPAQQAPQPPPSTTFANGQFNGGSRFVSQQLSTTAQSFEQSQPLALRTGFEFPASGQTASSFSQFSSPGSFIENINTRHLVKRALPAKKGKIVNKRGLVMLSDGAIVDEAMLNFKFEGLAQFGQDTFKDDLRQKMYADIEDEIREHDREPAEEEVKAVMAYCSTCDVEPFSGAIVFAWKDADVAIEDALEGRSVGGCSEF